MRALKELKELILSEIDKVNQKNDLSSSELQNMYYAVDVIKDIDKITGDEGGYSERSSYRRGRDRDTGRYVSRDGRYNSYESMMSHLQDMRSNASDPDTRRMVDKWIDEAERY